MPRFAQAKSLSWMFLSLAWGTLIASANQSHAQVPHTVPIAHAHNDYEHRRPLYDALQAGFTSVEADVYLVDNELLVAHDLKDTNKDRSLQSLYLNPLRAHFSDAANQPRNRSFWLMIDVKSEPIAAYRKIHSLLREYSDLIAAFPAPQGPASNTKRPPVRVVISGNRDKELILNSQPRLSGIDGRLSDLQSSLSAEKMPWISDNWRSHFRWRGEGEFPEEERKKLAKYARQAHAEGRLLRFWATPDTPEVWNELLNAKVDLINADDLRGLQKHLKTQSR